MRAIRNRYLARSDGAISDQPLSNALRAAATAAATSSGVAWPTSASGSSVAGEIVVYVSAGSSHSPPTKCPYRSRSVTMSRASGAGAYVQPDGTGARSCFRSSSVNGEVVRALVCARLLLPQLHQDVVQQRRRAEPVQVRRQPVRPERLVELHEVLHRLLRLADTAGGLH